MAQLNRADTLPDRLSPGEVVIPSLSALTQAKDYSGRLNLYDGQYEERGGGMTATAYVQPDTDTLVVDVTGANPAEPQTALLRLWALGPRRLRQGRGRISCSIPGSTTRIRERLAGRSVRCRRLPRMAAA